MEGWVKLHRKMLDNPIVCKDADHLAVWVYLMLKATHTEYKILFKGEKTVLKPGQLITGRKVLSAELHISESKLQRILKAYENEQQIEQQTSNANRLITILNWDLYQNSEQPNEQPMDNKRTASERQVNTNKNERMKEQKNVIDICTRFTPPTLEQVKQYCDERKNDVDAERFLDFYNAKGWMIGKNKMKDWKAAVRNWERGNKGVAPQKTQPKPNAFHNFDQRTYDYAALEMQFIAKANNSGTNSG